VGVFDILGFRDLILQADKEFPRVLLTSKLSDLLEVLGSDVTKNGQLDYLVFSDTIVIFAPDLRPQSYPWFLLQCKKLITKSVNVYLPLRGAISVGKAFTAVSLPIVIGPAFVEAHDYCEDQNWIGLILTPSAITALSQAGLEPLHHDFISDSNIPLRKCRDSNVLAYRFQNGSSNYESPLLPSLQEMKHLASGVAKEKYDNTIAFIKRHYKHIGG